MAKAALETVTSFEALIDYLRDELEWPLPENANIDNTTFTYTAAELGLKEDVVGGGVEFRQLRPMTTNQPWGIFFLNLPHKDLPQTLVRNILGKLTIKKRASANDPMRPAFAAHDLLFITSTGSAEERRLAFAHFQDDPAGGNAASLKVLGWDADDTPRRADLTQRTVDEKLTWPDDDKNTDAWRAQWGGAFTEKPRQAINSAKELAKVLAFHAQRIRDRAKILIAAQNEKGSLVVLHKAFKEALIHDLTPDAFADTYAQTVTYGLLSTAMSRASGALTQQDMLLSVMTTSPFLRSILETFIEAGGHQGGSGGHGLDFDELGVGEVVDFLRDIDMVPILADFDQKNSDKDPVVWLYQDFIEQYDKAQKFQRGVFYTPRQVVGFIVRSVDEVLRTELGLEDGLASTATWGDVIAAQAAKDNVVALPEGVKPTDTFVRILDPATGTGTFLVETVDLIHRTMVTKWSRAGLGKGPTDPAIIALWNDYVPDHLLPRLYGFELMMAPYAIAHMKLGLKLWDTGYRFASDARLRVHLTNALEPARDFSMELAFMSDALARESKDANDAKGTSFTAIIGNPPYAEKSKNRGPWIEGLMLDYKTTIRDEEAQIKSVSNDYVKFIRAAQWLIDRSGLGVVGYITSSGYLAGPLFRDTRRHMTESFGAIGLLDLHGSARRGDGSADDENVFEILQGVCIQVSVKQPIPFELHVGSLSGPKDTKFKVLDGTSIRSLASDQLDVASPSYIFKRRDDLGGDLDGIPLNLCFGTGDPKKDRNKRYCGGFKTRQDQLVVGIDEIDLIERIADLANDSLSEKVLRKSYNLCSTAHFEFDKARRAAQDGRLRKSIRSVNYRPFDKRPMIWSRQVLCEPQDQISQYLNDGNICLVASRVVTDDNFQHVFVSDGPYEVIGLSNKTSTNAYMFPFKIHLSGTDTRTLPNIAPAFAKRVAALTGLRYDDGVDAPTQPTLAGVIPAKPEQTAMFIQRRERGDGGAASFGPRDLFDWIYAVLHSPAYRTRYADYLKSEFARIPLPKDRALFQALIPLGTKLIALHLLDAKAAPELADPKGIRLAGSGEARVTRKASDFETVAWVGGRMYINETRWFEAVPERVANFHIGGYRPARKWLKDRTARGGTKKASDGRILTDEDILHYRRMITAMDQTIDLMAKIDTLIEAHGGWPDAFRGMVDQE